MTIGEPASAFPCRRAIRGNDRSGGRAGSSERHRRGPGRSPALSARNHPPINRTSGASRATAVVTDCYRSIPPALYVPAHIRVVPTGTGPASGARGSAVGRLRPPVLRRPGAPRGHRSRCLQSEADRSSRPRAVPGRDMVVRPRCRPSVRGAVQPGVRRPGDLTTLAGADTVSAPHMARDEFRGAGRQPGTGRWLGEVASSG
jgi:hypothetical protein